MADELPWMVEAKRLLGLREAAGPLDNPEVVKLYALAGHPEVKHDEVPWCAAFVGACLVVGKQKPTGTLAARDYETWGTKLPIPVYGCVGVKKRPGSGWEGHVGFVVGANQGTIYLLGGNQNDSVSIASFPRTSFTAFRWPRDVPISTRSLPANMTGAIVAAREA